MISRSIVMCLCLVATFQIGWSQPANQPTAEANLKFALELFDQGQQQFMIHLKRAATISHLSIKACKLISAVFITC